MAFHFQNSVNDWPRAVAKLPDRSCVKAVDRGDILRDVKGINPNIFTILRHWDDSLQHYDGNLDWQVLQDRARHWFSTHIDGTFRDQYAPFVDAVSWHNEIWANSQNDAERAERIKATQAAVSVWNNEYRNTFANDIKLVIGEAAVGNDMPYEIGKLAADSVNLIGYHPYSLWRNKWRDAGDWQYLSGRWEAMEKSWGIFPDWVFTEAGPFEGVLDGWKSSKCLGGDANLYVEAMRQWIQDIQQTAAYKQGRIVGFNLFTSGGGDKWKQFETRQPEMDAIADMVAAEWKPGTQPPPPPPPPPPDERGKPRVQYQRVYHVVTQDMPSERVGRLASQVWKESKGTIGGSWDDAMIGDLDSRTVVAYDILPSDYAKYINFRNQYYPGVVLKFMPWLEWPLDKPKQTTFLPDRLFGAPRDYDQDGNMDDRHEGLDLEAALDMAVYAMRDGEVIHASNKKISDPTKDSLYGNHVVIDHGGGWFTWYCHLDDLISAKGDIVYAGDVIGTAGNSGFSSGVHLHITVQAPTGGKAWPPGAVVDPRPLLGI